MTTPLRKESIEFRQTSRTGWILKMTTKELTGVLPPPSAIQLNLNLPTETNRPITPRHLGSIERFLNDTTDWALPPIILSAKPETIKKTGRNISIEPRELRILDGQHRLQTMSNLLRQLEIDASTEKKEEARKKLEYMSAQELPVVIFEVETNREHRQMFAWFARNKPIEPAVREYFDESDPFGKVAKAAMEISAVLEDRVTWKRTSVPARGDESKKLLSLRSLREIVTTIRIGVRRTPRPADREACWAEEVQHDLTNLTVEFFDNFLPSCNPNYEILDDLPELDNRILNERSVSYSLHPMTIRLMANAWARWKLDRGRNPDELAPAVGRMKLRGADPDNDLQGEFEVVDRRGKFKGLRHENWEKATSGIIRRVPE